MPSRAPRPPCGVFHYTGKPFVAQPIFPRHKGQMCLMPPYSIIPRIHEYRFTRHPVFFLLFILLLLLLPFRGGRNMAFEHEKRGALQTGLEFPAVKIPSRMTGHTPAAREGVVLRKARCGWGDSDQEPEQDKEQEQEQDANWTTCHTTTILTCQPCHLKHTTTAQKFMGGRGKVLAEGHVCRKPGYFPRARVRARL